MIVKRSPSIKLLTKNVENLSRFFYGKQANTTNAFIIRSLHDGDLHLVRNLLFLSLSEAQTNYL